MTALTPEAVLQVEALSQHYVDKGRPGAVYALKGAVTAAVAAVSRHAGAGLPAPRPYPELAKAGRLWIKSGTYWFAYRSSPPHVITAVFHDMADIPGRIAAL